MPKRVTTWLKHTLAKSNTPSTSCMCAAAGYDTTAMTLAHAVYAIASNVDVESRLLAEIDAFG